jgi:hypothetical protein
MPFLLNFNLVYEWMEEVWVVGNVTVIKSWSVAMSRLFIVIAARNTLTCRSQWPRGLRRRSTAACLLRSWVRIQPVAWVFVCCVWCVLSGRGLCDELITRPEESYRMWRVVVCDQETSCGDEAIARAGLQSQKKKNLLGEHVLVIVKCDL